MKAEQKLIQIRETYDWIINDLCYKAPEQYSELLIPYLKMLDEVISEHSENSRRERTEQLGE